MFYFLTVAAWVILFVMIGWIMYSVKFHKGQGGIFKPLTAMSIGVIAIGACLYIAYYNLLGATAEGVAVMFWEGVFTVIHDVYQLFSADSDYTGVFAAIEEVLKGSSYAELSTADTVFFGLYRFLYTALYALAPILTLGVILSIFKDVMAKWVYRFNYYNDVYIFSELNERSLAMAGAIVGRSYEEREEQYRIAKKELDDDFSVRMERTLADVAKEYAAYTEKRDREIALAEKEGRAPDLSKISLPYTRKVYHGYLQKPASHVKVIFLGVEERDDEEMLLADQARQLGGIIFRSGVLTTRLGFHSKKSNMNFFMIGENEAENVDTAIGLLAKYATRDNTKIYVFSDSPESELLLKSAGDESRKKAEREELAGMSKKEKSARDAAEQAAKNAEKERLSAQKAAIEADPENFSLYVSESESDYRSGALVKRVNVIRSLIYHTLYHFRFISDYAPEREAFDQKREEERSEQLEKLVRSYLSSHPETDEHSLMTAPPADFRQSYRTLTAQWTEEDKALKESREAENAKIRNIFERAVPDDNGDKVISAVVIGMGLHGTEMIKALSWYGQMEGYRLHINAFDRDGGAKSRFIAKCPELMSPKFNGPLAEGSEDCYRIDIHALDIDSQEFVDVLETLPSITYVAVCLGDDEKNLEIAVKLRSLCRRMGADPFIQAIRYNLGENEDFSKAVNFKGQAFDIDLIGDLKSIYSVEAILQSKLEHLALSRHMKWGGERSFWEFEYNFNSSIASALHHDAKIRLGLPGAALHPSDRTPEDTDMLRRLEHRRWNAYMRSEGYIYGKRDDLAKKHPCLVFFDELSLDEQLKDDD